MSPTSKVRSLADAVSLIRDGDVVAIGGHSGRRHPMALVREIVRQRKKRLHVVGRNNGIDMDMLIGAGCVETVETSSIAAGLGLAGNYRRQAQAGHIDVIEHSDGNAIDRFRAAAMGMPMMICRAGPGAALSANPHLKSFDDPFTGQTWLAVRAIEPDVAIVHAHTADAAGHVQLDAERWSDDVVDAFIARSARTTIVSVEQIVSEDAVRARPSATVLPPGDVACVVEAPYGAHPCSCDARYDQDPEHLQRYRDASASERGIADWLADYVHAPADHIAYLQKIGTRRLMGVSRKRAARP